jgi:NTP pyrophosphatase (non-canonical NTP hydrolase)
MKHYQTVVRNLTEKWTHKTPKQWAVPTLQDAVDFLVTEAVEVLQERLRLDAPYVRHRPAVATPATIGAELANVLFMAFVVANLLDIDLEEAFEDSLRRMEAFREGNVRAYEEERNRAGD